jgi:hypothetical protein
MVNNPFIECSSFPHYAPTKSQRRKKSPQDQFAATPTQTRMPNPGTALAHLFPKKNRN